MNKITITIETNNAAFNPENNEELIEVSRILQDLISKWKMGQDSGKLRDINGNLVGLIEIQ